jgi:hypothetical protein
MPGLFASYLEDDRGMRYPKPGGCIGIPEGDGGKTRFTTVTEEYGFVARCGRGEEDGSNVLRIGGGNVDTTWETFNETRDDVVICEMCIKVISTADMNNVPRRSCARDLNEGM